MENTWNKKITLQGLADEKAFIREYLSQHPNSALISRYFDEFRNAFVFYTNAIEGTPITEYDTAYILKSNEFLEGDSARDNMEVLGSSRAWDYVLTQPELSLDTIQMIHKNILFFDVEHAGVYRKVPVHVGDKQMLPPEEIAEAMESLLSSGKENKSFFETIAEIHLRFENIHPFVDGNGRTGRMLLNLQMLKEGYLPINIKKNEAGKYYRCFRQYDKSKEKEVQELFHLISKYEQEELFKLRSWIEQDMINEPQMKL